MTKLTSKFQVTMPKHIRKALNVKKGEDVEWHIVKQMVVVDVKPKIQDPVGFLTSQIKLDLNAVELVKQTRDEFA